MLRLRRTYPTADYVNPVFASKGRWHRDHAHIVHPLPVGIEAQELIEAAKATFEALGVSLGKLRHTVKGPKKEWPDRAFYLYYTWTAEPLRLEVEEYHGSYEEMDMEPRGSHYSANLTGLPQGASLRFPEQWSRGYSGGSLFEKVTYDGPADLAQRILAAFSEAVRATK